MRPVVLLVAVVFGASCGAASTKVDSGLTGGAGGSGQAGQGGGGQSGGGRGGGGQSGGDGNGPDGGGAVDSRDATTASFCNVEAPFGAPHEMSELNSSFDQADATLTDDELTVYFTSNRLSGGTPDLDIFVATRAVRSGLFGTPARVDQISSIGSDDRGAAISPDGLRVFFHSSRVGGYDIWTAAKPDLLSVFGAPALVAGVNQSTSIDQDPWVRADGQVMYFTSDRTGTTVLYRSALGPAGFGTPTAVGEPAGAVSAVTSADDRIIYFSKNRSGTNDADIWMARRTTATDGFGSPVAVPELNTSAAFEYPSWLSRDLCRIYFMRGYRIFMAERALPG